MKTRAVRLYAANDMRLEEFELPELKDNEILIKVISDSACASTYKAVTQGVLHKRVPNDIGERPIVIGHELCGEIVEVGAELKEEWKEGQKIVIQPALNMPDNDWSVGYSFPYVGGNMTYAIVPKEVLDCNCLLAYEGSGYFKGSLVEPLGCILRAFKGMYHNDLTNFERIDGVRENGKIAILGGAGPMGLGAIDIALNYTNASMIVVTDLNEKRLNKAKRIFTPEAARKKGKELIYVNTSMIDDQVSYLRQLSGGFDDVLVMVPVAELASVGEKILGLDGCMNFFAGPAVHELSGDFNLYRIHYDSIHILGTAGSVPADTEETLKLIENGTLNPAVMVSHIMGINSVISTISDMAKNEGFKKVCYTGIDLPLTSIDDFEKLGENDPMFKELDRIVKEHDGLWCEEAEKYLLKNA